LGEDTIAKVEIDAERVGQNSAKSSRSTPVKADVQRVGQAHFEVIRLVAGATAHEIKYEQGERHCDDGRHVEPQRCECQNETCCNAKQQYKRADHYQGKLERAEYSGHCFFLEVACEFCVCNMRHWVVSQRQLWGGFIYGRLRARLASPRHGAESGQKLS
jgi:hypothetical protein